MNVLYTATGCTRCKIVKGFMKEREIPFEERDMKAEGKEDFKKFYAANRKAIFRGQDGVEFPVFYNGIVIRQGIGPVIAYLHSGENLNGFFSVGTLHKEWVDGLHISGGDPQYAEKFLKVLSFMKSSGMKLQIDTNGKNSDILRCIREQGLAEVVIMSVVGPRALYSRILGEVVDLDEVQESMAMLPSFPKYQFQTTIVPVNREKEGAVEGGYLTPEEVGETARFIAEATGSKRLPYFIRLPQPEEVIAKQIATTEGMTENMLLPYRSAARMHQVFTEIEKH